MELIMLLSDFCYWAGCVFLLLTVAVCAVVLGQWFGGYVGKRFYEPMMQRLREMVDEVFDFGGDAGEERYQRIAAGLSAPSPQKSRRFRRSGGFNHSTAIDFIEARPDGSAWMHWVSGSEPTKCTQVTLSICLERLAAGDWYELDAEPTGAYLPRDVAADDSCKACGAADGAKYFDNGLCGEDGSVLACKVREERARQASLVIGGVRAVKS